MHASRENLFQTARFILVGGFSTGVFIASQYVFIGVLKLSVIVGTTLSFAVSLLVSYVGHHTVTFRRKGHHRHYGPRFAIVTALMLVLSNLVTYVMVEILGTNYLVASVAVGILYPAGSFVLQTFWVFPQYSK